ncbi:hypothetical protein M408DRAFT_331869 [Serendipita vermifera MAFF 305830]|uniref:CRAL-TRIO domain-containing protein n=1 Tax=Serendipita vermifera MAFF 305830 TaxID=933852 RepID=A0A0C2X4D6_SERVB|nr:hypothetical protein M408DRAFT_331869 [Serendipita vermifera MAFF 305830]
MSQSTYQTPPGRLGNLSAEQQTTLDKFRHDLSNDANFPWTPARHGDATLLRFLRARKFDLALSKKMIYDAEQWRKDFGVDELVKNFQFPEKKEVDKYYPQYYHKTDKDGRPIYIEVLTNIKIDELYKVTTEERLLQRLVVEYERSLTERLPAASEEAGHPVETYCTILDLTGVGIMSFYKVQSYVAKASAIGQNYYPETMGVFYIIHNSYLFNGVWTVVKGFLDPVTIAKFRIIWPSDLASLKDQIPVENLPSEFKGNCKCVGGCSLSDEGPWKHRQALGAAPSTSGGPSAA